MFTLEYFVHIYYTHMPKFGPSRIFGPSKCLVPTPGLTVIGKPHVQCVTVCVCVYPHVHPQTLSPPSKNRENTDITSIFPNVKNNVPRQQQVPCQAEPPHCRAPTRMSFDATYLNCVVKYKSFGQNLKISV